MTGTTAIPLSATRLWTSYIQPTSVDALSYPFGLTEIYYTQGASNWDVTYTVSYDPGATPPAILPVELGYLIGTKYQ